MRADQINLQVPGDAPESGLIPIRVCVGSNCSEPVQVAFTSQDIILRVKEPLFTKMPVWVAVEIPMNVGFGYPLNFCPWDFGGYEFEIRKDGQPSAVISKPQCQSSERWRTFISDHPELPLHLIHKFDEPGTYEIRLHGPILNSDGSKVVRVGYSEWTRIAIFPVPESLRAAWLSEMQQRDGKISEIVSLLAWPDEAALIALKHFLPTPLSTPSAVRLSGNLNEGKHCVALNSLAAFPESLVAKVIPAEQRKGLLQWKGFCR